MTAAHSPAAASLTVFVDGIGLVGPGFSGWEEGRQLLAGLTLYAAQKTVLPSPLSLPAAERRRAGAAIKVALAVGHEAIDAAALRAAELPSVFSSSSGDGINCHEICSALASADRLISPTRFHNSVHNAASGYWNISTGAMCSSSVLCAFDGSFAAGLLEAMTQAVVENTPVLLVAYDTDYPEPLRSKRPVSDTMGVALVIAPRRSAHSVTRITLQVAGCLTNAPADVMDDAALEFLRQTIPAACALPLLQAIAKKQTTPLVLTYLDGKQLAVEVAP